jgi:predicted nucleic acid-binding protein
MNIVVDTNIIFSALVNSNSAVMDIIVGGQGQFRFYASDYTHIEIENHYDKLKKVSKLTDNEIGIAKYELFKYLHFVTLDIIPENCWRIAEELVKDVDIDDVAFVALALYIQADLWTGDKTLYHGLKSKGFLQILFTAELRQKLF